MGTCRLVFLLREGGERRAEGQEEENGRRDTEGWEGGQRERHERDMKKNRSQGEGERDKDEGKRDKKEGENEIVRRKLEGKEESIEMTRKNKEAEKEKQR